MRTLMLGWHLFGTQGVRCGAPVAATAPIACWPQFESAASFASKGRCDTLLLVRRLGWFSPILTLRMHAVTWTLFYLHLWPCTGLRRPAGVRGVVHSGLGGPPRVWCPQNQAAARGASERYVVPCDCARKTGVTPSMFPVFVIVCQKENKIRRSERSRGSTGASFRGRQGQGYATTILIPIV